MELIDIKINRRPELLTGIKIQDSTQWLLINTNPVDYVLDGYSFINKRYIKKELIIPDDDISYKIMNIKYKKNQNFNLKNEDLKSYSNLLYKLQNTEELIEFEFESSDYCIIGKIIRLNEKSFIINTLSSNGKFLGEENFKFESIRVVNIKTDYLISLNMYINDIST